MVWNAVGVIRNRFLSELSVCNQPVVISVFNQQSTFDLVSNVSFIAEFNWQCNKYRNKLHRVSIVDLVSLKIKQVT